MRQGVPAQSNPSTVQPATPGQSPEHWGTKSFSSATVTALVVALIAVLFWRFLIKGIRLNLGLRIAVYLSEAASAIGLSLIATYFDIFKKSTYVPTSAYQPDWHVPFWMSMWAAMASYYLVVKLLGLVTKETEEVKSKKLTEERDRLSVAVASLERQRNFVVKVSNFAKKMVSRKVTRLCSLLTAKTISPKQFVDQLNPDLQIESNVKLIYEFFKPPDGIEINLRLALWVKTSLGGAEHDKMVISYSWNGERHDCFTNRSTDRMKLLDPLGARSEVVRFYSLQAKTIKVIPNCIEAAKNGEFEFFYPEQKDKVASMILYKHVFNPQTNPEVVILLLVSSVPNTFHREDEDQFRTFFDEMLTRIEMEWVLLELTRKLDLSEEAA